MVVACLFVHPSVSMSFVTDVLWLSVRSWRKTFYRNNLSCALNPSMQNFSDLVQEEHFQIWG